MWTWMINKLGDWNLEWPAITAYGLLVCAGIYLARKVFGSLRKSGQKSGCGSCGCDKLKTSLLKKK
jgi:hypothetical protein